MPVRVIEEKNERGISLARFARVAEAAGGFCFGFSFYRVVMYYLGGQEVQLHGDIKSLARFTSAAVTDAQRPLWRRCENTGGYLLLVFSPSFCTISLTAFISMGRSS